MLALLAVFALLGDGPGSKALPAVVEPDWSIGKDVDPKARDAASAAWADLRTYRAGRRYKTDEELATAKRSVASAYEVLDANNDAAAAVGSEIIHTTRDDWERLMVAISVARYAKDKGKPFLLWAMAKSATVDETFEPTFRMACSLADERQPENLPAIFVMLRAHEGSIPLLLHSWVIPTNECLFYAVGRYGREVIPYLRPMLAHDDPYVRRNAAILLGYFMDGDSTPALLKLLEARDVGSEGAAFALGELGVVMAVPPIARLLESPTPRTRFSAAYSLYEIGSKDALPALKQALAVEKDENVRPEIEGATQVLEANIPPFGSNGRKLNPDELRDLIARADARNGLEGDVEAVARSATAADLDALEEIRRKVLNIPSDKGNRQFRAWTAAIKAVRRRLNPGPEV